MSAGSFIAEMCQAYGVTHCFFMDAILRRTLVAVEDLGIQRVLGHSEKGVAYMADGYARVSGRPGLCMAQSVGAANLAAGMQDAYLGQSPVIAITGRHVAQMQDRNSYQELPHQPMFASVTKFDAKVETAEQLPRLLRQAFREATSGTPRPVHLDVAGHTGDVLGAVVQEFHVSADPDHARAPAFRPRPDPEAVKRAAEAISRAARPIIVVDRGAMISGAEAAIAALAAHLQIPIAASPDAKTVVAEDNPLFAGILGLYGRSYTNRVMAEADLVIFAGSGTNDHTTCNWTLPADGTAIIQIDLDPSEIGRNYSGVFGIQADVRAAIEALTAAATAAERDQWMTRVQELVTQGRREVDALRNTQKIPMRPERLCHELTAVLPENAILIADTGYSTLWTANLVDMRRKGQTYHRAAGSLGWAFPASLGAKCAAPARPVVCFTGDGGFFYHLPELETARRRDLQTVTVVNNNRCLAQGLRNINTAYEGRNGNKDEIYAFRETDFAKIARAFDCFGVVVERPQDFAEAFNAALASGLPAVIDVRTEFAGLAALPWTPR
jgi:acetolactate synthase-1/2/3 large subunit